MTTFELRSVIRFGADVSGVTRIGGVFRQQFGRAQSAVGDLTTAQRRLRQQMDRVTRAGGDISALQNDYDRLGREIDQATRRVNAFNRANDAVTRMRGYAAGLGVVAASAFAAAGTVAALGAQTNLATAKMDGMAKSYGMSAEQFKAWGGLAERAGLNAENTGDLVEELSNKFGEFKALGAQSAVSEVFGALGIDAAVLEGLTAADQFELIMRRLERVKDTQQAASLADMLNAGEANKIVTYIRSTGKSLDELLVSQKQFNLLTVQGTAGAVKYSSSFTNLKNTVSSAWAEIAGIAGGEMAGEVDTLAVSIGNFVRENKTELVATFKSIATGARDFGSGVLRVAGGINSVVMALGGWQVVGTAVASLLAGKMLIGVGGLVVAGFNLIKMLGAAHTVMGAFNLVVAANPIGLLVVAVGAAVFAAIELYKNWDSVTAWFAQKFAWFSETFPRITSIFKTAFSWNPLGLIIKNWQPVIDFFGGLGDFLSEKIGARLDFVVSKLKSVGSLFGALSNSDEQQINDAKNTANTQKLLAQVAPANKGTTVNQTVEKIEVVAAAGQSPEDVGRAVHSALAGRYSQPFYDFPQGA